MTTPTPPVQPASPVPAVKPATAKPATADIQALLGTDQPARWWARPSLWIGLAVLAAAAGGIYFWQAQKESNAAPVYVTEALRKGFDVYLAALIEEAPEDEQRRAAE